MTAPKQHDFRLWIAVLNGQVLDQLNGVKVEFPERHSKKVGGQGEVTRSKSADQTSKVTLTVPETSIANTLLDQMYEADVNAPGGISYPFILKDAIGTTLVTCLNAWVMKKADIEEATESGEREWIIDCGDTEAVVAGK